MNEANIYIYSGVYVVSGSDLCGYHINAYVIKGHDSSKYGYKDALVRLMWWYIYK